MITIILIAVVTITLLYLFKPQNYWSKRNVHTGRTSFLFGDSLQVMLGNETLAGMLQRVYNRVGDVRYIGFYEYQKPILMLKSPELIKKIFVTDEMYFMNHKNYIPEDVSELWTRSLLAKRDQEWLDMRPIISHSFTKKKMKSVSSLINQNSKSFVQHYLKINEKVIDVNFLEILTKYCVDVMGNIIFGIDVNSLGNGQSEFYVMVQDINDFNSTSKVIILLLYDIIPSIMKFFRVSVYSSKAVSYFKNLVKNTIQNRQRNGTKREDLLHFLCETRNHPQFEHKDNNIAENSFGVLEEHVKVEDFKKHLNDVDITAQIVMYFHMGIGTVSKVICFMAYELALNEEIQKKLREEIDANRVGSDEPSYEAIMCMKYMDMVVCESLRKWPMTVITDRYVSKPYTIQPELPQEKPVALNVDTYVMLPIYCIHHDPKYYPDPEKFDPERFSKENRTKIHPYTYFPLGLGQRNCVASRLAILEVKTFFFYLLSKFEIVRTDRTEVPLKISKTSHYLCAEDGFNLGLRKRVLIE